MSARLVSFKKLRRFSIDSNSRRIPKIDSWFKSLCITWLYASRKWEPSRSALFVSTPVSIKLIPSTWRQPLAKSRPKSWKSWSMSARFTCKSVHFYRSCIATRKLCCTRSRPCKYHSTSSMTFLAYVSLTLKKHSLRRKKSLRYTKSRRDKSLNMVAIQWVQRAHRPTLSTTIIPFRC